MKNNDIIPNLFKTEYSKLVAVLAKTFGINHIEVAEDLVSETFVLALDTWPYQGVPVNPTAWLYTVAKNKVKNHLNRDSIFKDKIIERIKLSEQQLNEFSIDLTDKNIADSQLQMLFTICHPSISSEAQISLALRILCGFGLDEIANAFLSNKETIHKRLQRAKSKLKSENIEIEMPDDIELSARLNTVLHTIYLLFSEGYYSESHESIIRKELCVEALNLGYFLINNPSTNTHSTNALMSLMCFQSSRLEARQQKNDTTILYENQNKELWDQELIEKGFHYLQQASKWKIGSKYYLEASIAYWYTVDLESLDKWGNILKLYDALVTIDYSPIIALNRIFALSKVQGNLIALQEAEKMNLKNNHFYFVLLAELYKSIDSNRAKDYLQKAYTLCKTKTEKEMLRKQIEKL